MDASVVILPSPLLPPVAYGALENALGDLGVDARLASADLRGGFSAGVLVERWARMCEPDSVLVAHSNAGYLAPAVRQIRGGGSPIVFMDAALPPPAGEYRPAPARFLERLAGLADERGILPPWTRWWTRDDLAAVVPEEHFDAIDVACPQLPIAYFEQTLTAPAAWIPDGGAYLAFGETYAAERQFAEQQGWPVLTLDAAHLHHLVAPDEVARAILSLAAAVRSR